MGGYRSHTGKQISKSSQNSPILVPVLIFWVSIPCACIHTLLRFGGHYNLSVLSMSLISFQKSFNRRMGGWGELYPIFI